MLEVKAKAPTVNMGHFARETMPPPAPLPARLTQGHDDFTAPVPPEHLPGLVTVQPTLVLPDHAARWFRLDSVHPREQLGLPEFFDSSSTLRTPEHYREYRNFMINAYQQNPQQYLAGTACRMVLAGDVCAILRVHAFLEHYGLINFMVMPAQGLRVAAPAPLVSDEPLSRVASAILSKVRKGKKGAAAEDEQALTGRLGSLANRADAAMRLAALHALKEEAVLPTVKCASCEADCSARYYYNVAVEQEAATGSDLNGLASAAGNVCVSCYEAGKLPDGALVSHYTLVNAAATAVDAVSPDVGVWTDRETMLLLDALEHHGDNWDSVAKAVGTKSPRQCLLHFVRLPIEEPFTDPILFGSGPAGLRGREALEAAGRGEVPLPFGEDKNPVLSLVAFLCSTVDPTVAAAASEAAIARLEELEGAGSDVVKQAQSVSATALAAAATRATAAAHEEQLKASALEVEVTKKRLELAEEKLAAYEDMIKQVEDQATELAQERLELQQMRREFEFRRDEKIKAMCQSGALLSTPMTPLSTSAVSAAQAMDTDASASDATTPAAADTTDAETPASNFTFKV